jgi:small subunit ribosomal protein S25e
MGGKKKLSLKQMERMQSRKDEEKSKSEKKSSGEFKKEKKTFGILMPDPKNEKIISELKKMKVITPFNVASKFELRISVAKDFLEQLEKLGVVNLVSKSRNTLVYQVAG